MRKDFTQEKFDEMDKKHQALLNEIEFLKQAIEEGSTSYEKATGRVTTSSDFAIELAQRALELHDVCQWFEDYGAAKSQYDPSVDFESEMEAGTNE